MLFSYRDSAYTIIYWQNVEQLDRNILAEEVRREVWYSIVERMSEGRLGNSEDIGTLMEMFALEFSQAEQYYQDSNFDLNQTIEKIVKRQKYLPPGMPERPKDRVAIVEPKGGLARILNIDFQGLKTLKDRKSKDQLERSEFQREQQERLRSLYRKQYITQKMDLKKKRNLNYKKKTKSSQKEDQEGSNFNTYFEEYLGKPFEISFREDLNEVFEELWDSRKLVVIHLLNVTEMKERPRSRGTTDDIQKDLIHTFLKDIYLSPKFSALFNKEFINYGLDPNSFQLMIYPHMKEFINPERDRFCLIFLRINEKTSRVALASKLSIFEFIDPRDFQGFKKKLMDKKRDINRIIDAQFFPNILQSSLDLEDKRKIEEDREIRQNQEIEYEKLKEKASQQEKNKERLAQIDRGEKSKGEVQRIKQSVIESMVQQQLKQRQLLKSQLPIYLEQAIENPFQLKLRFPSGKQKLLLLPRQEQVDYIFKFINCLEDKDLGFVNDEFRSFDLIQPLQSLSLEARRSETIGSVFEDSDAEMFFVRENC